jgi:hypothetical protein
MPFNQHGMKQAKLRTVPDLIADMEQLKSKCGFLFSGDQESKLEQNLYQTDQQIKELKEMQTKMAASFDVKP